MQVVTYLHVRLPEPEERLPTFTVRDRAAAGPVHRDTDGRTASGPPNADPFAATHGAPSDEILPFRQPRGDLLDPSALRPLRRGAARRQPHTDRLLRLG